MFEITNISNNPLPMSDGKNLAPGDSRKLKALGDRENKFASRGFLRVIEEKKDDVKPTSTDGGKK